MTTLTKLQIGQEYDLALPNTHYVFLGMCGGSLYEFKPVGYSHSVAIGKSLLTALGYEYEEPTKTIRDLQNSASPRLIKPKPYYRQKERW